MLEKSNIYRKEIMTAKRKLMRNLARDKIKARQKEWRKGRRNEEGQTIHIFEKRVNKKRASM